LKGALGSSLGNVPRRKKDVVKRGEGGGLEASTFTKKSGHGQERPEAGRGEGAGKPGERSFRTPAGRKGSLKNRKSRGKEKIRLTLKSGPIERRCRQREKKQEIEGDRRPSPGKVGGREESLSRDQNR